MRVNQSYKRHSTVCLIFFSYLGEEKQRLIGPNTMHYKDQWKQKKKLRTTG